MSRLTSVAKPAEVFDLAQTAHSSAPDRGHKKRRPGLWIPFALITPAVLLEILIHLIPMITGIWISFIRLTKFFITNWSAAPFVGLNNYRIALDLNGTVGTQLLNSFVVTCGFTVLVVGVSWVFGMSAAVALQNNFRGRGFVRTLFLVPYALPAYTGIIAWKFMFQKDTGAINQILFDDLHLGGMKPFWLIGDNAFAAVVTVAIWKLWPFAFLMLMAGLQNIPTELYEASAVDGAKPFLQWRRITLPMLRPVNLVLILVTFLWTFNDFNTPYVLFGSSGPAAGDLISLHIYSASFLTWNFGFGAAMSVLLLLFLLLVAGIYLLVMNRRSKRA